MSKSTSNKKQYRFVKRSIVLKMINSYLINSFTTLNNGYKQKIDLNFYINIPYI